MKQSNRRAVRDGRLVPVGRVATRTLRSRLEAVWKELPRAGSDKHRSPESVHRLRVASRRALAALDAFDSLLPGKGRAWFERQLRRLRRAAGEARDLDVLTDRLSGSDGGGRADGRAGKARSRLVAMLSKQRDVSRQPIRERYERLLERDWPGRIERLLDAVPAGRRQPTFRAYARRRFKPMIDRFFASADRKLRSADELHALRIEGKRLRYAMEIFANVFPAQVRARCYESLEQLQKTLGEFTDHSSAADRFRRWADDRNASTNRDTIERLRDEEETLADEARKVFAKWWNPARRRKLRRSFERTLRRRSA